MADLPRNWEAFMKQLRQKLASRNKGTLDAWLDESPDHQASMETVRQPGELLSETFIQLEMDDEAVRRKFEHLCDEPALITLSRLASLPAPKR